MNCRRIQEMIPLYTGGDLDRKNAALVSSHLRSCQSCSSVAGQYNDSQEWLQSYRPPELGSAFFDDLKREVFAQIELEESRPSFFQAIAARWKWSPVMAAVALLAIIGGLVFYMSRPLPKGQPGDGQITDVQDEPKPASQDNIVVKAQERNKDKPRRRYRRAPVKETIAQVVELIQPDRNTELPTVSLEEESAESKVGPSLEEDSQIVGDTVSGEQPTRIEIQTADPNIRIIWFVPKDFDKLSNRRATDS
jgi:hypothetical protein